MPSSQKTTLAQLRSGQVMTTAKRKRLFSFADETEPQLAELDEGMAKLGHLPNEREERVPLQRSVDQARSLSSPIRTLPIEILFEIFRVYCHSTMGGSTLNLMHYQMKSVGRDFFTPYHNSTTLEDRVCPALKLAKICMFWRTVALSLRDLWSSLTIELESIRSAGVRNLVTEYLANSGTSPLRLDISQVHPMSVVASQTWNSLIDTSGRWANLTLELNSDSLLALESRVQTNREDFFPILQILEVAGARKAAVHALDEHIDYSLKIFDACPQLHTCYLDWARRSMPMNCSILKMLVLHEYIGISLAVLLSQCPRLERLELGGFGYSNQQNESDSNYCHTSLTTLALTGRGSYNVQGFQSISLPGLEALDLLARLEDDVVEAVLSILTRSRCSLQNLTLHEPTEQMMVNLLSATPSISHLTIHTKPSASYNLFRLLTLTLGQRLAPALTSCTVEYGSSVREFLANETEDVCTMIESRCRDSSARGELPGLRNLKVLGLYSYSSPEQSLLVESRPSFQARIGYLKAAGFMLHIGDTQML